MEHNLHSTLYTQAANQREREKEKKRTKRVRELYYSVKEFSEEYVFSSNLDSSVNADSSPYSIPKLYILRSA